MARDKIGMRLRGRCAVVRKFRHLRPALLLDKISLEVEPACSGANARADRIVAHRHNGRTNAKAFGKVADNVGQRLAGAQPPRSLDMNGEIGIAQTKPGFSAQPGQSRHERPGLVAPSPSGCGIIETGERVKQSVDVRRDVQAKMLEIVSGVGDNRQFSRRDDVAQAKRELGAADTAGKRKNAIFVNARLRHRNKSSLGSRSNCAAVEAFADHLSPRTTTIGVASSACPISSDAAAAISSAKPVSVTCKGRS